MLLPGEVASGFIEHGDYFIDAPFLGAHLCIDEERLALTMDDGRTGWRWCPGFYAGMVMAELLDEQGKVLAEFKLDVAPDHRKLGADIYAEYVNELLAFDPRLLFGTESAQSGAGTSGEFTSLHLRYARLRRYGPPLVRRLAQILAQPLARLGQRRALKSPREARRFDHQTVRHMRNRPACLAALLPDSEQGSSAGLLFNVSRPYENFDNPANRALSATLRAVIRRTKEVASELSSLVDQPHQSETRTPLGPKIQRRLDFLRELAIGLERLQRSAPFSQLSRREISAAGLSAISAHPVYASAFRLGWFALRNGVVDERLDESLWLCPTWEIYERWCFLKVVQALQQVYMDLTWDVSYPGTSSDYIQYRGVGRGEVVTAWLQLTYPAGDAPAPKGFSSVSGERRPDVTVLRESDAGTGFVVLDAKYRVSRSNVLDGMSSAHLYRDSLRWRGFQPKVSLLLVPKGGAVQWLETTEALKTHGVGVHQLSNSDDVARLSRLLRSILGA